MHRTSRVWAVFLSALRLLCSQPLRPLRLFALLLGSLGGCVTEEALSFSWRVDFECDDAALRAHEVTIEIAKNDCSAPGALVYEAAVQRGRDSAADPGNLANGPYAFSATARDEHGSVIAGGCVSATLPRSRSVVVTLASATGCALEQLEDAGGRGGDAGAGGEVVAPGQPHLAADQNTFRLREPIQVRFVDVTKPGAPFIGIFVGQEVEPRARFDIPFSREEVIVGGVHDFAPQREGTYLVRLVYGAMVADEVTVQVVGDRDGDRVDDLADGCPDDPKKTSTGMCGCGRPESGDRDADGVLDCADECPDDGRKKVPGTCGCGFIESFADQDGDGTSDCFDACPGDRTKVKPLQCGCGEPDTDTDNDGTADCTDLCPNDPAKLAPATCGCGASETDADQDGVAWCFDACDQDPGKMAPGVCGCGVADIDTDQDHADDCVDGCPMDAKKIAAGACGCGAADVDSDRDGRPDCQDACPKDKNKLAPGTCGCGTPDKDTDVDGTLDCLDRCPRDPGKTIPLVCGCGKPETDTDGDGTLDCQDGCVSDPAKAAPGACGCGQPDTDTDGDQTADCIDGCFSDPLKIAPGICGCGKQEPYDVSTFRDSMGLACSAWRGLDCTQAVETFGYTQTQEDAVLANCSKTCKTCPGWVEGWSGDP